MPQMLSQPAKHRIVLLGIGHTNAHILKQWRMSRPPATELVCVSNFPVATYSGMLPGVLAGQYEPAEMQIDLVRLTSSCGARLIVDDVTGLDREHRRLLFRDREPLDYDWLSIGIGSVPSLPQECSPRAPLVAIKPMQTFLTRVRQHLDVAERHTDAQHPCRIVVVGGGAGGVEIAMCMGERLGMLRPEMHCHMTLVNGGDSVPAGAALGTRNRVMRELRRKQITLRMNTRIAAVRDNGVETTAGELIPADIILWAGTATAPGVLSQLGLETDDRGFVRTHATLQSVTDPRVFAVGDTGSLADSDVPKAGVYAVRQGPVLWENLQRAVAGKPFVDYQPQSGFLKILNTGDGRAIAEYHGWSWHGRGAWWLKNRIDQRFMAMYQKYPAREVSMGAGTDTPVDGATSKTMRCAGCGGKIGADILSSVLRDLAPPRAGHILVGLDAPDDAAVLSCRDTSELVITTDFFTAPLDDWYAVGRIAALNALSDLYAMDAVPHTALAMVSIPPGEPKAQQRLLRELLAGSMHELNAAAVALAGGHTIEQDRVTIGFTVLGNPRGPRVKAKSGLRVGDRLIVTKPLGTGVLLAAHSQASCEAGWYQALLQSMLQSNRLAIDAAIADRIRTVTDVTGFGLAGHLLEMLRASDVSATVSLKSLQVLPGAVELLRQGWESTLAQANRRAEADMSVVDSVRNDVKYPLLFDPQTSGGLILAVAPEDADHVVDYWQAAGQCACVIGTVTEPDGALPRLRVES
jgi:selenide,water dikinase